jgi:hypothetical protein
LYFVAWGVQSVDLDYIDFWQGRLDSSLVDDAVFAPVVELQ